MIYCSTFTVSGTVHEVERVVVWKGGGCGDWTYHGAVADLDGLDDVQG